MCTFYFLIDIPYSWKYCDHGGVIDPEILKGLYNFSRSFYKEVVFDIVICRYLCVDEHLAGSWMVLQIFLMFRVYAS
jgi:hypothetical protein